MKQTPDGSDKPTEKVENLNIEKSELLQPETL
jgi:hypothetical protein